MAGLMIAACGVSGAGTGDDGKADTKTRFIDRDDGLVEVTMKSFKDSDLHDSAEDVMLDKQTFGFVELGEGGTVHKVDKRMYREERAIKASNGEDVTNDLNIYSPIEIEWEDLEDGGSVIRDGVILAQENASEGEQFLPLQHVYELACEWIVLDRLGKTVAARLDGFKDSDIYESAKRQMMGKSNFGAVSLDATVVEVRTRMYHETAWDIATGQGDTNPGVIYVRVRWDDGSNERHEDLILGRLNDGDGELFRPLEFVHEDQDNCSR